MFKNTSLKFVVFVLINTLFFLSTSANAAFPRPVQADKSMVASAHYLATQTGAEILKKGGNAFDAAVATAFSIGVVLPYSAGIGGGGFALLRNGTNGEISALDFREKAPKAAFRDMYLDRAGKVLPKKSVNGYWSVGIPGTVEGLYQMHKKYGKLSWEKLVEPAILLASKGYKVSEMYAAYVDWRKEVLGQFPASQKIFMRKDIKTGVWRAHKRGELFVQKDLARTLKRIQKNPRDFYEGTTAKMIAKDMAKNGGLLTFDDLKNYKITWRKALCGSYRGYEVCSMPPPSSGGVHILQMLNVFEWYNFEKYGYNHPQRIHLMTEAMRQAYADRAEHLGDPKFYPVPVQKLIAKTYSKKIRNQIPWEKARKSLNIKAVNVKKNINLKGKESHDTSHLTVADQFGNVVTMTFTVNYGFGSGVVTPRTGVLLNDEMDDFSAQPGTANAYGLIGGEANSVASGKIPLSSMSPTIVSKNGEFSFAAGSPGGSTIITTVLQQIIHVIDDKMNAAEAVAAPRMHHQTFPDELRLEKWGFDTATQENLQKRGHKLIEKGKWGNASMILRHQDGSYEGAADPRGEGSAVGGD